MISTKNFLIIIPIFSTLYFSSFINAATFTVVNGCTYPIWAVWATASPGGSQRLDPGGQPWTFDVPPNTKMGRLWGRTNCNFDANGQGQCDTGDCTGGLTCQSWGRHPNTLAEFTIQDPNNNNLDTIDISLVEGFNIPIDFSPTTDTCRGIKCNAPINEDCPNELRTAGGCNNPCQVFNTVEYCCTSERGSCGPTNYSNFFKQKCPDAYSFPQDDQTSTFTCPGGTNYKVTFCPA